MEPLYLVAKAWHFVLPTLLLPDPGDLFGQSLTSDAVTDVHLVGMYYWLFWGGGGVVNNTGI